MFFHFILTFRFYISIDEVPFLKWTFLKFFFEKLNKGEDFLLQHWEVQEPVGPCNSGIGSTFMKIKYPFLRYNLFYYVYALSFYDKVKEGKRFQEAYKQLKNKTINNKLVPENPHRAWNNFDFVKKGQINEIGTKCLHEIKNNIGNE